MQRAFLPEDFPRYRPRESTSIQTLSRLVDALPVSITTAAGKQQDPRKLLKDGWMSPRMRAILNLTAEMETNDALSEEEEGIRRARYIPTPVLVQMSDYESFKGGWGLIWIVMHNMLNGGQVPTVTRIQSVLARATKFDGIYNRQSYESFLAQGGKIEFALDALITISHNVMHVFDDGWEYVGKLQEDVELQPAMPGLDDDFDLAWIMCIPRGGGSLDARGPYPASERYDGSSLYFDEASVPRAT
jgi:hypothetical protein